MPTVDVKIASVWGLYEGSLTQNMRDVRDTLLNRGYELTCKEVPEGHSWGEWRANTDFILEYIFPALPTGVADRKSGKPKEFQLSQNYPNPFNPSTTISYSLPDAGFVSLKVYSLLGQEVSTLVNRVQESGNHSIRFNADKLPSGVYLYRLNVQSGKGQISYIRKMILLK